MSWTRRKAQKKKKQRERSQCSFCGECSKIRVIRGEHGFSSHWGVCVKVCKHCKTVHLLTQCERFMKHYDIMSMIDVEGFTLRLSERGGNGRHVPD